MTVIGNNSGVNMTKMQVTVKFLHHVPSVYYTTRNRVIQAKG